LVESEKKKINKTIKKKKIITINKKLKRNKIAIDMILLYLFNLNVDFYP